MASEAEQRMRSRASASLLFCIALGGCGGPATPPAAPTAREPTVQRAPEDELSFLPPHDRERVRALLSAEEPHPRRPLDVEFDHGLRLLGCDVSPERVAIGEVVTITWYWIATKRLPDGWRVFTHVADGANENRLNQDDVGVIRRLLPAWRWPVGRYVRDEQPILLPEDWNSDRAVFYVGFWNGPHRLGLQRGPTDGESRARALILDVVRP